MEATIGFSFDLLYNMLKRNRHLKYNSNEFICLYLCLLHSLTVVEYFSAIYTNIESSTIVASTANTIAPSTTPTNTPVSTTATTTTRATSSTTPATTLSTTLTLSTRLSTTLMLSTKSSSAATTTTAQTTLTTRGVTPVTKGRQSLVSTRFTR